MLVLIEHALATLGQLCIGSHVTGWDVSDATTLPCELGDEAALTWLVPEVNVTLNMSGAVTPSLSVAITSNPTFPVAVVGTVPTNSSAAELKLSQDFTVGPLV